MLGSTNDKDRDQSFSMKIETIKEGEIKATAKSFPHITAVGPTAKLAASRLNQELQTRHREGRLKDKK